MNILIGEKALNELSEYLFKERIERVYVIIDENVYRIYNTIIKKQLNKVDKLFYILSSGEKVKTLDYVLKIYDHLIENYIDRDTVVLSIGGGVVGDVSGFVASTFKRGLKYIQIPTTLLAQVDSSIGGKVGINYGGYKNIIGSFYLPEATIIDIRFLNTLDRRQIISGLAEIIKYGLISDYELFVNINNNINRIYEIDKDILLPIIKKSVKIKQNIVNKDFLDKGERKKLNFGHTIGHALESHFKYSKYYHGEAVILGIIYESNIAMNMGLISEEYFYEIYKFLSSIVTPLKFEENEIYDLFERMKNDKKNKNKKIFFILPTGKGKVELFDEINKELIINSLKGEWIEN